MKRLVILGLTLSSFTAFYAQTLQDAVKKVQNERYELAQKDFESLVKNNPTSVENAFFFGNYYVTIEDNAKAIEQFKAAASKNPEDKLAKVAAAKATYFSGDTTAAGKAFCELIKATKNKNAMVLYRIAETYATGPKKNYNEAEVLLNQAIKLDPSNQDALMLLGDVILAQSTSRVSECVGKYNEALKINANNVDAIVRKARIYERVGNNDAAIQGYEQSERLDPNFATAFRYHAELSIKQKKFDQAQVLWEKYLALNNDVEARTRYAASLYAGERYGDAFTQYKKIEEMGLSTFQTKRAIVYTFIESKEKTDSSYCAEALKYSDDFFALAPANRVTARDYKYRVETYLKMKNFDAALVDMMKATAIDSSSMADQFTQLGSYYSKQKNYDKTIEIYTTKEKFAAAKMKTNDYFELAKAYYFNKTPNYLLADTSFAKMLVLSPNFAVGYAWRGRCMANTDLNPNARTFAGKPHYEKFLTTLTEKELQDPRYKDFLLEANRYLGDYYVNSKEGKDLAKAKTHWGNVQTLDPNDKQAKAFFAAH